MYNDEIYISTDVETDGPIPGPHSMLSLGAAAYRANGDLVDTFTINLETLPGASGHPDTMKWWGGRQKQWNECRSGAVPPKDAMERYAGWVKSLKMTPVFVGYPAGFDFEFVHWYLVRFLGTSVFSFSALDMKTFAMAILGTTFRGTTKKTMPRRWFEGLPPHTHVALDDAIEQGALFVRMLQESPKR
jgi:hypothetical protein